ncbi:MAG TPA: hypothetical protein VGD79_03005 [Thermoanaerobaculia bacterium]|jgi:hypothetical protein
MTGVFSAISGVFGRAMIIGALLPATLFVLFLHLVLVPMLPWEWTVVARLDGLEPQWKLAAVAAVAVVLAGLLDVLNIPIVRFYEGYSWLDGLLGQFLQKRQAKRYLRKQERSNRAGELARRLDGDGERIEQLETVQADFLREDMEVYPPDGLMLPTRLGNIIRSFENYPYRQYRIAGVELWPRFYSRLTPAHAKEVEETRTSFNVTVHLSFLSLLATLLLVAAGCIYPIPFASWSLARPWLWRIFVSAMLAWLFYGASLNTAVSWGHVVRAAFDLHRDEVLRDLGVANPPQDLQSERALWDQISAQIIYGDPGENTRLRFDVSTIALPARSYLDVTRAVVPTSDASTRAIVVRVDNRGAETPAVRVIEHLATGTELVWESASVRVEGTNPYTFFLGTMKAGASRVFVYKVLVSGN